MNSTDATAIDQPICFECEGEQLVGVLSHPTGQAPVGVVIIVGGPQYRAGSHRQFASLARRLAAADIPVLRFDYRGMGDSGGYPRDFQHIDADIRAAIDALTTHFPNLQSVALWGLCDAASAALMYAHQDDRVKHLILVNPWARGEETLARTHLKHYYLQRLLAPEFWRKVLRGEFRPGRAAADFRATVVRASASVAPVDYRTRMLAGWTRFKGKSLLLVAGADMTAQEFLLFMNANAQRQELLAGPRLTRVDIPDADHTFSRTEWQAALECATVDWLRRSNY